MPAAAIIVGAKSIFSVNSSLVMPLFSTGSLGSRIISGTLMLSSYGYLQTTRESKTARQNAHSSENVSSSPLVS